jgi:hypothetical protein
MEIKGLGLLNQGQSRAAVADSATLANRPPYDASRRWPIETMGGVGPRDDVRLAGEPIEEEQRT